MKMLNSSIHSTLDYCCLIWNSEKEDIDKIERIQRSFTSKNKGLEGKNYHKKIEILTLNSLERGEGFFIINVWQQIKGKMEYVQNLETNSGKTAVYEAINNPTSPRH